MKILRTVIQGAMLAVSACAVAQSAFPSRPVVLVVPGPPGGITDTVGRMVSSQLGERLGRPLIVENQAGANWNVASQHVERALAGSGAIGVGDSVKVSGRPI